MSHEKIELPTSELAWLAQRAQVEDISINELVCRALRHYRAGIEPGADLDLPALLESTCGLWRRGDGLSWQRRLRDEW